MNSEPTKVESPGDAKPQLLTSALPHQTRDNLSRPQSSLALVGAGYWGKNLARNFHALGALHIICDSSETTLSSYDGEYTCVEKRTRFEEVLELASVTQVAIAAPAALHYELAKQALAAGKDVFVEKPLCLHAHEAEDLLAVARARQRVLMVGHLLQYHPCIQKLQALVAQGELGKLHYITSNRLHLGKIRREENALWSFAPHDLSVILALAGNELPEQVRCTGESYLTHGVADTTLTHLRFSGGVRAHVYVSWLNPFKEQKLTVVGSNGMVVFDDTRPWNEKLILHRHYITWTNGRIPTPSEAKGELVSVPEAEPLRQECQHFLTCCRERRTPRTDAEEGLRVLRVLQAAQSSLETDGEAVFLPSTRRQASITSRAPSLRSKASTEYYVHPTAVVDEGAEIGKGTRIWHFSHIMKGAMIGRSCVLGQNVNVGGGAVIGNNVKIQNNVSVYTGLIIEDDVFLGPSCVLTNVPNPRSQVNRHSLYERTVIKRGATIGANATIVCGVTVGRYAFVGAGAVVTRNIPDYALVVGNPAKQKGWMSRHGLPLVPAEGGVSCCPESGLRYKSGGGEGMKCIDLPEESPLPERLATGKKPYSYFKRRRIHGRTHQKEPVND